MDINLEIRDSALGTSHPLSDGEAPAVIATVRDRITGQGYAREFPSQRAALGAMAPLSIPLEVWPTASYGGTIDPQDESRAFWREEVRDDA